MNAPASGVPRRTGARNGRTLVLLSAHEDRLGFAGSDIAAEGAGWIEGAVGSGIDAAAHVQRVLDTA
jgi:monoamine oxidase